ncbi:MULTISPECIES: PRC-barrel domain containing protein [Actinosynnema]|uniref:PRC-barrel domain containing protein n=1 Tax=Actinosynnema TaxID=40566 RepID=UPI0020A3AC69|nr:PRC-barrel domain containing protein [Actinosynnema pretiosum]MCP2097254.1 hypothetical protein [Actinosynnema pretiosum]
MYPNLFYPWAWRDPSWLPVGDAKPDTAPEARPGSPLVGYSVEATDGGIGKVHEDDAEVPADCLVVDTGPWIFGRKVVLPIGTVERVDHEARTVHVDRTKDQIKDAPEFTDGADHEDYRTRTGDYYTESYRLLPPML